MSLGLRASRRIVALSLVCFVLAWTLASVINGGAGRRPLDLPVAVAQTGPGNVAYYGLEFAGDTFVWCFDVSSSMDFGGQFLPMKQEIIAAVGDLSPNQSFSLVAYSSGFFTWSPLPLPATPANVASATALLTGTIINGGGNCMSPALLLSLDILQGSASPIIFLITDGSPNCTGPAQTLADVAAANPLPIPIHTFAIPGSQDFGFLQDLAAANGGTFTAIANLPPSMRRGDVDGDGACNIGDAIVLLAVTFAGSTQPICADAADFNDDGELQGIPDAIAILSHLFVAGSPAPPFPFPGCGIDPTADALACATSSCP